MSDSATQTIEASKRPLGDGEQRGSGDEHNGGDGDAQPDRKRAREAQSPPPDSQGAHAGESPARERDHEEHLPEEDEMKPDKPVLYMTRPRPVHPRLPDRVRVCVCVCVCVLVCDLV